MPVASGSFDVSLTPQSDDSPIGRRLIDKTFSGDLVGNSRGQMLAVQTASGTAAYVAIEQVTGTLDGRAGEFALVHRGEMSPDRQDLQVTVLEGSGTGELTGLRGSMTIEVSPDTHRYALDWSLPS